MAFELGRRNGSLWNDAKRLNEFISEFPFQTTGKKEKDFEIGVSQALKSNEKNYENGIITQIHKDKKVSSVYCFGKNHRPDLTINDDGIAFEIKYIRYDGLADAIGQGYLYRLRYKFVFLILVISDTNKPLYEDIETGKEKDLEDILNDLAEGKNIFTYIVPAFVIKKPGVRKCISFFR